MIDINAFYIYNYCMKKFFKTLLILIVVVASVGGTCYIFYKNLTVRQNSFNHVSQYLTSSARTDFDGNLVRTKSLAGSRFNTLVDINSDLEEITNILNLYLTIAKDYDVDENTLINELEDLQNLRDSTNSIMEQYFIHCEQSQYFDKAVGANVAYKNICNYLVEYARFTLQLKNLICSYVGEENDIKFSIIDLYMRVIISDLSNISTGNNNLIVIADSSNINLLINNVEFKDGYLYTDDLSTSFGSIAIQFVYNYKSCDKNDVAKNLSSYVINSTENSTNVNERVGYLFKTLYSIN